MVDSSEPPSSFWITLKSVSTNPIDGIQFRLPLRSLFWILRLAVGQLSEWSKVIVLVIRLFKLLFPSNMSFVMFRSPSRRVLLFTFWVVMFSDFTLLLPVFVLSSLHFLSTTEAYLMWVGIKAQAACVCAPGRAPLVPVPSQSFVSLYYLSYSLRVVLAWTFWNLFGGCLFAWALLWLQMVFLAVHLLVCLHHTTIWMLGSIILQMISCNSL